MCAARDCDSCELAVYCYSDESTWVFRTKQEMLEKLEIISKCPIRQANLKREEEGAGTPAIKEAGQTGP